MLSFFHRIRAAMRGRWRHWWLARLPHIDILTLTQRNIYILPTGAGWMLTLTLLVLLLAAINFQLNLGYLLAFLLAGCGLVGMYIAHATLRGLTLRLLPPEAQFLGTPVLLRVQLHSTRPAPRRAVAVAVHDTDNSTATLWAYTDVPANGSAHVEIAFRPTRRGLHAIPLLTAQTLYPLGTFRVWTLWRPATQVVIYPHPEVPYPPLPMGQPQTGSGASGNAHGVGEFDGVRAYRRGDPLKLVVWKKAAQTLATGSGEMVSRDTQHNSQQELWLDFSTTHLPDTEARLSRLTAWVLQADQAGLEYGLRLPGTTLAPASGSAHRQRCLQALALCQ